MTDRPHTITYSLRVTSDLVPAPIVMTELHVDWDEQKAADQSPAEIIHAAIDALAAKAHEAVDRAKTAHGHA